MSRPLPIRPVLGRRAVLAGAAALLAAPAFAGDGALVFDHVYGRTVLKQPAKRVVSLGYTTQDSLLALGVMPVAIRYWYGDYDEGVWPWAQSYLGDAKPLMMRGEPSAELIAGVAPDLIYAVGAGLSRDEYDLLSRIAPVIVQEPQYSTYGTPWRAEIRTIGRATGTSALAEEWVARTEAKFADLRGRHPDWKGQTAAVAWHDGGQSGVYLGNDTRCQLMREMGFADPPGFAGLTPISGFYADLSPEDLSPIDADVLIWISPAKGAADIAAMPMRRTLRAWREGREILTDEVLSGAMSFASVLSMPYALERLEPEIALAIDGDPATVVPSAEKAGLAP